jgi:formylglycine-generating enzyme required for sulfatase activity
MSRGSAIACAVLLCLACALGMADGESGADLAPLPEGYAASPTNTRAPGEAGFTIVCARDGMELVLVPGGPFLCGGDRAEVDLPAFYVDRNEVTSAQFARFVAETGYHANRWRERPGKELHPAVDVSLHDCEAYAEWVGRSIPTDEQWEKAARGEDGRDYPWGDDWRDDCAVTPEGGYHADQPVGSLPQGASPYGALDMVGNVWEWTCSQFDASRISLRGGAWDAKRGRERANCTYRSKTGATRTDGKLGFRCVLVP